MNNGQFANLLVEEAKNYRNTTLLNEIVPQLNGKKINPEITAKILEPYMKIITSKLEGDPLKKTEAVYVDFLPKALEYVHRNVHMHDFGKSIILDQNGADAILIGFVNEACVPLDLSLYSFALKEKAKA